MTQRGVLQGKESFSLIVKRWSFLMSDVLTLMTGLVTLYTEN